MSRQVTTRGTVYASHLRSVSVIALQVVLVAAALWLVGWVVAQIWVILLPVILAVIVCTVLWPPVRWLRSRSVPPALAALVGVVVAAAVIAGVVAAVAPSIADQVSTLSTKAVVGIRQVQDWLQGPPLNISDAQLDSAVSAITDRLESSGAQIASGFFTGVSAATSALITLFTTAVITFFLLKDGPRFLPWLRRSVGSPAAPHLAEVLTRMWRTLGGFVRTQAVVSLVDAVLIGIGLVILGVPLAYVLAIVTFVGGFVPIVGAFVAGALAVLIALVSNGLVTALIVLAIIVAVQQLEGNVLQPWLQSKSMNLHAVIVLLAVTLGGTLFGVVGAFLAVPVAACGAVAVRYYGEQVRARSDDPEDVESEPVSLEKDPPSDDDAVS
ncbi:MAG: AI-2E family transporter [Williamsia herbipolensis]|uniref:PurR-regulated permease PerM n=1 Tax=Williamsia serinedens TaxID=391736 RepID=A0ABT1H213_9NOCA|nr:AI-2E family transporter [Williamsia serinedens]MBE7161854.1 AI-2E family transporter [Williamsia herbipolensis]MCP2161191.1 putative PurR-regulated permease PerM [Williamsia serinedens]